MWRCLDFPLLSSQSYREPGLVWSVPYISFTLLLSACEAHLYLLPLGQTCCSSQCPAVLGLPLSVLRGVGEESSVSQGELGVMWRNLFASFSNPLMCSVQRNPSHEGFLGYRTITHSQYGHLPTFLMSHGSGLMSYGRSLMFQKNCQNHVPL